ncbi:MAG: DNA cytosine methyltransferase [Melioribacter sp.]|nr:DNA cytosine methyltransferase [Melioribacter sp.]
MNRINKRLTFIDLFAGAGGLSEGFYRAGFTPIAHVEKDNYAALTLKTRSAYHYCLENNLEDLYKEYYYEKINREEFYNIIQFGEIDTVINEEISNEKFDSIVAKINEEKKRKDIDSVDLIIGGPPCQAYSLCGRKKNELKKEDDKRIAYYKLYARFLIAFKPKMFVFENVPGLLSFEHGYIFDDLKQTLAEAGYVLDFRILNASSFGVLQDRKRIIIIGWKKELELSYPKFGKKKNDAIVNDILNDLQPLNPGSINPPLKYAGSSTHYLKETGIRNGYHKISLHNTRPHNKIDLEIYKRAIDLWNNKQERLSYERLPEKLKTHKNQNAFLDRYKVVAGDKSYSHTLVAHIAKDGHYYIHPDINQCRSISVREAARIQSFPDNFFFEGPRTATFTQIGNAVPPLMAYNIATHIFELLT